MKHVRRCRWTVIAICAAPSLVCVPGRLEAKAWLNGHIVEVRSDGLVLQDVEGAYASFESSRERVQSCKQTYLSPEKESLGIEEFSSRSGAASIPDFLDAERTYRATQLAYRQQLAAYPTNLAQLEAAVGAPLTP